MLTERSPCRKVLLMDQVHRKQDAPAASDFPEGAARNYLGLLPLWL